MCILLHLLMAAACSSASCCSDGSCAASGTFGTHKAINVIAGYHGKYSGAVSRTTLSLTCQGAVDHPVAHDVFGQGAWPDPDLLYSYTPVGGSPPPKCGGPGVLEYCTGSFCDPVPRHSRTQAALWCSQSSLTSGTTVPQDLLPLWCLVVAAFTALSTQRC